MKQQRRRRIHWRYKRIFIFFLLLLLLSYICFLAVTKALDYIIPEELGHTEYTLVAGVYDKHPEEADPLFLMAMNRKEKKFYSIAIPGNTQITNKDKQHILLQETYGEGGIEDLQNAVENLLHIKISHYAVIREQEYEEMIDHFGGLEYFVEMTMSSYLPDGMGDFYLQRGVQDLNGKDSANYMRYLDEETGEIGLLKRRQRFLKNLFMDMQRNIALYNLYLGRMHWHVEKTNLSEADVGNVLYDITSFPIENCTFAILPGEVRKDEGGRSIWLANSVDVQKSIADTI